MKNTYIAGDILLDLSKIEDTFLTMVGIPNANTEKRERLITDEVNANNIETKTLAAQWLENLKKDVSKVNSMFNLNITVDWRFTEMKEGENNDE